MYRCTILTCLLAVLLSLQVFAQDAVFSPDKDGYVRDWLACGPFPSEPTDGKPEGFDKDFLASTGVEKEVQPYIGQTIKGVVFKADNGKLVAKVGSTNVWGYTEDMAIDVVWKKVHTDANPPIIDLGNYDPRFGSYYVVYLAAYVFSDYETGAQVRLGSDDDYKLWVNGELVGQWNGSRGPEADSDKLVVRLKKGGNRFLFKVCQRTGGAGAILRITDGAGTPMTNLKVRLELPERRFLDTCKNIERIDDVANPLFARIDLGQPPYLVGNNTLDLRIGSEKRIDDRLTISVTGPDGKHVWQEVKQATLRPDEAWVFGKDFAVEQSGTYTVTVQPADGPKLERKFLFLGLQELQDQNKSLREQVSQKQKSLKDKSGKLAILESALKVSQAELAKQSDEMAKIYADQRRQAIKSHGRKSFSIDTPFSPEPGIRSSLCLNGDLWEIAPARSTDRYKVDEAYIPTTGWEPVSVPTIGVEYYFRHWPGLNWPVKGGDFTYSPAPQAIDRDRAAGFMPNEGRENNAMYLRTTFDLPEGWNGKRVLFNCELANYKVRLWCNGQPVGEYLGWTKPMELDMTPCVKPGKNELMAFCGREWLYGQVWSFCDPGTVQTWGLMGDVTVKSAPEVYVSDVWVKTSWRKAMLTVHTWLTNTSGRPRTVILSPKAVKDGAVKLTCSTKQVTLPANSTMEVVADTAWADPELWDIGKPNLYYLVSDVIEDGKVVDEHFQRFGFREVWTSRFDFWLNGKRLFIQGDVISSPPSGSRQYYRTLFNLLRKGNINCVRTHFAKEQTLVSELCDELGMFHMPNMYPSLPEKPKGESPDDVEKYRKSERHKGNLERYKGWVERLRNHPSVIVYSTDNEIFTQANPKPWDNSIGADRLAALYEPYVESLDPTRLVTRDGDQGTWGWQGAWQADPPSRIANYHYPEFDSEHFVFNWQSGYRKPLLIGETLYVQYGAWNGWIGAIPSQVAGAARYYGQWLTTYRDLEIPGWVSMGLNQSGYIELKPGGSAWDLTPIPMTPEERAAWFKAGKNYPGGRIAWPAQSGPGMKEDFANGKNNVEGTYNINWLVPGFPVIVPNAVNKVYEEVPRKMPPLPRNRAPEVIYRILKSGQPAPGAQVFLTPLDNQPTDPIGVWADKQGKAWFLLKEPGKYRLTIGGTDYRKDVAVHWLPNDIKAGLDYMPTVDVDIAE